MGIRGPYDSGYSSSIPQTLGERLKWLRIRKGLTQTEAALALQTDAPTISSWERDRAKPSGTALVGLAAFYGVQARSLETGEGMPVPQGEELPPELPEGVEASLTVSLDRVGSTGLVVVEARSGRHKPLQHMDGMQQLVAALNKGRRVWMVIE